MTDKILLNHGAGGELSHQLIKETIIKYIDNDILTHQTDSAVLNIPSDEIAYTTDSYVVDPIFFPGGNIGKLAVCGTVNDLAVSGAKPEYLSLSFILEEGFSLKDFEEIIRSIGETANEAGVKIVTGDTKVVNKGKADKIFINTSGIGTLEKKYHNISFGSEIKSGDKIIINGSIADHGVAILTAREKMDVHPQVMSDCAPLNKMIAELKENNINIKFMRDATRGGIATVLKEISSDKTGIDIFEKNIKIKENVRGLCEMMGFDPLYLANEGKVIIIIDKEDEAKALEILRNNKYGKESVTIGEITDNHPNMVILETIIGGKRVVDMLTGEQLPRIC